MVASQQGKKIKHKTGKHLRSLILAVCNHNLTTVFFFSFVVFQRALRADPRA